MLLLKQDNFIVTALLSFVVFTMPLGLINNINPIAIVLLTGYSIFLLIKERNVPFVKIELQVVPLIYFFFLLITLIYSENLIESIKQLEKNLPFLLFPLLFFILNKHINKQTTQKVIFSFVLGNVVALMVCLFYSVFVFYFESYTDPLLKGSFYFSDVIDLHPTYFSMYLILCIAFIRNYILENKVYLKLSKKLSLIVLILFISFSIFHLKSRSGVFTLILVGIILIKMNFLNGYFKIYNKVFLLLIISLVAGIIFLSINGPIYDYSHKYFKRDTNTAIDDRLRNWKASLDAIPESPFFGSGLFDAAKVRDKHFYINGYDEGIDKNYNSHNQFIESALIGGLFGFSILLVLLFNLLVLFKETKNATILCFFIILFMVMITESILVRQHGIVFFSFFYVFFNTKLNDKQQ